MTRANKPKPGRVLFHAVSDFFCAGCTEGYGLVALVPQEGRPYGFMADPATLRRLGEALVKFAEQVEAVKGAGNG